MTLFVIHSKQSIIEKPIRSLKKERYEPIRMSTSSAKQLMIIGIDDSEPSWNALQWTIDHFIIPFGSNSPFKLFIVHVKPTPSSTIGLGGPGAAEVLPFVDADLKKIAARVLEKAKEICDTKSVHDVALEVIEGDARFVLCDLVEKHHASVLVVGSHGYGAIKRAVLGSVSDYCAHHAHCSVMIVKKPKHKH